LSPFEDGSTSQRAIHEWFHEYTNESSQFVRRRSLSPFEDGSTSQRAIHKGFHETSNESSQFVRRRSLSPFEDGLLSAVVLLQPLPGDCVGPFEGSSL
jgi:hypothetical protein